MKNKVDFKIASFNISGGFYIGNEDNEYLDREAVDSVDNKLLQQIINIINSEQLDVICFQEIITTERIKYIQTIVKKTQLKFYDFFELSECNIVKNTDCGLAILSKYPMKSIIKEIFPNPRLSKTTNSGNTYYTYNKGYMMDEIEIYDKKLKVLTHHGFPYRRFNSTPEKNKEVFKFFDNVVEKYNPNIITGDFNAENFMVLMNKTSNKYKRTINSITTVDGKMFDDILLPKEIESKSKIVKLLSDHYIIINEINY
ncbi:MAG: endonuclease/exonuclease/phosphatase family protein [Firmicutes bacterium]|nr:endonuclease/exonuclease/phosphatase family protein [Bacillota bacterium]